MTTVVEQLSAYAGALRYEDLPAVVVAQAKRLIIDSVGCALGGYSSEPAKIAREMAATVTSSMPATLLGSGQRTSLDLATFANGVMIRFLDFNDGYTSTGESGHPSDSIAAILTVADAFHRSGKEVIVATVLAYEVFCRICDQVDLKPIGFDHVTVGGMASTAAAARLFGLSGKQFEQAMNLGIAPNIALYQTRIGHVSMWKGCAYANASRNAVFATMLASRGMTGPAPIFEGVGGYFKAVTRAPFQLPAFGGPDTPYKILECSIKRYPLGQYSQTVVQAALELRGKVANAEEIAEIRIETVTAAVRLMAGDPEKWTPATRETADHSMPYIVAVALIYGTVESQHFDERYLRDPAILALAQRVKVAISAEADRHMPHAMRCDFTLVTKSGATHKTVVDYHKGHYRNPMTDAEVEAKFRPLAAEVLTSAQTDRLLAALWRLDEQPLMHDVMALTVGGK
ncbi:MAG: prpD [Betaproteobacteria bacterium]|nr:prpD [Betaproteobacteria bacterium]